MASHETNEDSASASPLVMVPSDQKDEKMEESSTTITDTEQNENSNNSSETQSQSCPTVPESELKVPVQESTTREYVDFKVVFNKKKYDVTFPLDNTIAKLKTHIQEITGVPVAMQKVMFKGLAKDECTLQQLKVTKGAKIMVVGSTLTDVLAVNTPASSSLKDDESTASASSKEPLCKQKLHKKVLDKYGKPEDVSAGFRNRKDPLPPHPVSGMYNKAGSKVRLTFKLELDQLWIGTKERTDKIPMGSIKAVVHEPITDYEDYHMMGIQLGPTEASRYWIYWVPANYADAIKDTILGKWQYF